MKNKRTWENKGQKVASQQKKTQNSLKSHKLVKKVKKKKKSFKLETNVTSW